jgi:hypothetical protein
MRLEDIGSGISLTGLEPTTVVTLLHVIPIADGAVQVIYKLPDGTLKERLLNRADEATIEVATAERPWSFDGDGANFKLAVEASSIRMVFAPHFLINL